MARSEIVDRTSVEILVDDGGADVRRTRDRRGIPELLPHAAHDGGDDSLLFRRGLDRAALGKGNRRGERSAPRAEVLRRELVAEVGADVVVQAPTRQVVSRALFFVAEQRPAAGEREQLLHRVRDLRVDERRAHEHLVLRAEMEPDTVAAHADVAPGQGGDSERLRLLRVALPADPEPRAVDQARGNRADPLAVERVVVHVLRHRRSELRQLLREADELVVLRLLLLRPKRRVVEVLPPAGGIQADRLQLPGRARRDPDVLPRRRDHERLDALELRLVGDLVPAGVVVREPSTRPHAAPTPFSRHRPRVLSATVETKTTVVLEGDETGQELLEEALRVLAPDVVGLELEFLRYDLSLESRRATDNQVVHEAASAIRTHGLGLKAATITPEGRDDVGSPNRIIREEIGGRVIVRTGRRIPGVVPLGGVHAPISIVRMAVGDAYGAKEWREGEGDDEVAYRTERIERRVCHSVAEFAFRHAERAGAKVFGGPKYTVSPTYEGMLKEEMDAAAERHSDVPYEPQLIDATFALLLSSAGDPLVIPALNRDGDILSDLVLPLFGSIAGSESLLVAFGDDFEPAAIMAEAAHGTAPSLQGKNVANPMAMILAGAALLSHGDDQSQQAGRAIREACLEAVHSGARTSDLGGHLGTSEFTDEVIARVRAKLDVWASL